MRQGRSSRLWPWALGMIALWAGPALAHGIGGKDAAFVAATKVRRPRP